MIGEVGNGLETIALAAKQLPDVVVMDVAMPDMNGIEATRRILTGTPDIKIVALSGYANKHFIREMLTAGASAYILKSRAYEELAQAVHAVVGRIDQIRHPRWRHDQRRRGAVAGLGIDLKPAIDAGQPFPYVEKAEPSIPMVMSCRTRSISSSRSCIPAATQASRIPPR